MTHERLIGLADLHVKHHDPLTLKSILFYLGDVKVNELLLMGDFMDLSAVSTHNESKPGLWIDNDLASEYEMGNAVLDALTCQAKVKNKACQVKYLEGNHEERALNYVHKYPYLKGQIEAEHQLHLAKRGIKYIPCESKGVAYKWHNLFFIHGLYTSGNHAAKTASAFKGDVFYGHKHTQATYTTLTYGTSTQAHCVGYLAKDQEYLGKKPSDWVQGFLVIDWWGQGYNHNLVKITNHSFAIDGKLYTPYGIRNL